MQAPLISIIGATGTGKSQLAVDLALAFNGEVINGDAMQMYSGLPIITNKITPEERRGVPHHLLGHLDAADVSRVGRFVKEATETIADIRKRGRLPILVGGTHYYVQSLLYPHSVPAEKEEDRKKDEYPFPTVDVDLAEKYPILNSPPAALYEHLKEVDPIIAARWHPNDHRKIRRSLDIYYSTDGKKTASEVYAEQRAQKSSTPPTGTAATTTGYGRYNNNNNNNLIFWVHARTDALHKRLDSRVDKMIDSGMWQEIKQMEELYDSLGGGINVDTSLGIWQSIGFKEFLPYLETCKAEEAADTDQMAKAKAAAVERVKISTRQYAKAQVRWVRIKLLNSVIAGQRISSAGLEPSRQNCIYLLDSSDVARFDDHVVHLATGIVKDFLASRPLPDPLSLSKLAHECLTPKRDYDLSQRPDKWVQNTCGVCNTVTADEDQWLHHLQSRRHRNLINKAKRRKEIEEFLRAREAAGEQRR